MTSLSHDVTSLDRDVIADDVISGAERSLLGNASQQREMWRHDVTACQRHVDQITAHVSTLTSGDAWRHMDTNQMPGSPRSCYFLPRDAL